MFKDGTHTFFRRLSNLFISDGADIEGKIICRSLSQSRQNFRSSHANGNVGSRERGIRSQTDKDRTIGFDDKSIVLLPFTDASVHKIH